MTRKYEGITPAMIARVLEARDIAAGVRHGLCPVICTTGFPCRRTRAAGNPACGVHMSREERGAADTLRVYAAQFTARWESRLLPACWFWTLPNRPRSLAEWQAGRCAVCGITARSVAPASFRLVVDHDHRSGLVRGLLCRSCNKTESQRGITDGRFTNYRSRPAAALLGVRIPYHA